MSRNNTKAFAKSAIKEAKRVSSERMEYLLEHPSAIKHTALLSFDEKLFLVNRNPTALGYFDIQEEALCLAAIELEPHTLTLIKPNFMTDKLIFKALSCDGLLLPYVNNPTLEMEEIAVNNAGRAICYVKVQTERLRLLAVNNDGMSLEFINNPSNDVMYNALVNNPSSILFIKQPSVEMELLVVKKDYSLIKHITNPHVATFDLAMQKDKNNFKYYKSQSLETLIKYLKQDGLLIRFIDKPKDDNAAYNSCVKAALYSNPTARRFINGSQNISKDATPVVST